MNTNRKYNSNYSNINLRDFLSILCPKMEMRWDDSAPQAAAPRRFISGPKIVMISLLECPICLKLLCQPLTTSCGHSFCRGCLIDVNRRNRKECPACNSDCYLEPRTHFESIAISSIAKLCFPEEYALREVELKKEMEKWDMVLPLYVCRDVVLPNCKINAQLFEEKYQVMTRQILDGSRNFCYLADQPPIQVDPLTSKC